MLVCDMCLGKVLSFERNKFKIRKDVFSDMLTDEYNYALDMQVKQEEAFQQGAQQQAIEAAINLLRMEILSPEQIAQAQDLPLEKVFELQKSLATKA